MKAARPEGKSSLHVGDEEERRAFRATRGETRPDQEHEQSDQVCSFHPNRWNC